MKRGDDDDDGDGGDDGSKAWPSRMNSEMGSKHD